MTARQLPQHPRPRTQCGGSGGGGTPRPHDLESLGPPGNRLSQAGLADAGLAGYRQQGSPPGARGGQRRVDLG
jgi:hypothetical protein